MRHNSVVPDTTHGLIQFHHLTIQIRNVRSRLRAVPQSVLSDNNLKIPRLTRKTIAAFVDHLSQRHTTYTVNHLKNFTETVSLLISHSMSSIIDRKVATRVKNATVSPYTIKKDINFGFLSGESGVIQVHQTSRNGIFSMIWEGDPDLVTYLNELVRTKNSEKQNNKFWFPLP